MQYVVPFYSEALEGFAETSGFLRLLKHSIQVEFQTKDAIIGVVKTSAKKLEISLDEIIGVQYKSNIFRTVIQVTTTSFELVEAFSSVGGNMDVKFRIKRKHKKLAEDFVDNVQLFLAEHHLQKLEASEEERLNLSSKDENPRLEE